jgi:hypothetical protein
MSDVRDLTAAELEQVAGGHPALIYAAGGFVLLCMAAGDSWELPVGTNINQAAAALGMSHLL